MNRLQLRKGPLAIEADNNEAGMNYLKSLRKSRNDLFKGGRIHSILQIGFIQTGIVYIINGRKLAEPSKVSSNPFGSTNS